MNSFKAQFKLQPLEKSKLPLNFTDLKSPNKSPRRINQKSPDLSSGNSIKSPNSGVSDFDKLKMKRKGKPEEDLDFAEIDKNIQISEKEHRILKFIEEENIIMVNPKEKQFEYFEQVKQNAFLVFSTMERSHSEKKRFSLDGSSLLTKKRNSLQLSQRLQNEELTDTENKNKEKELTNYNMLGITPGKKSKFTNLITSDRRKSSPLNSEKKKIEKPSMLKLKNKKKQEEIFGNSNEANSSDSENDSESEEEEDNVEEKK